MIFKNEYLAIHFISLQKIYRYNDWNKSAPVPGKQTAIGVCSENRENVVFPGKQKPVGYKRPLFPFHSSIQEVAGIHLNTGLIRIYFEYYTGLRRRQTGSDSRKISFSV